jgi:peptidoglycan/xylan/chitin deacetylase (PgdA/CDA1 family)
VPPEDSDIYRHDLSVGADIFGAHLITLREQGYTSITLSDLFYAIQLGKPLPEKPIVLIFDDGYRDNYLNAFPIMKEEGFVGTFFVITNLIEEYHENDMTWEQLREMQAAGMEIGSHTKSHAELP